MVNKDEAASTLICRHLGPARPHYLCAPMIAYGEIQGILHLRSVEGGIEKYEVGLAGTVADYIGLALANLKLREALREQSIHDHVIEAGMWQRLNQDVTCFKAPGGPSLPGSRNHSG